MGLTNVKIRRNLNVEVFHAFPCRESKKSGLHRGVNRICSDGKALTERAGRLYRR